MGGLATCSGQLPGQHPTAVLLSHRLQTEKGWSVLGQSIFLVLLPWEGHRQLALQVKDETG